MTPSLAPTTEPPSQARALRTCTLGFLLISFLYVAVYLLIDYRSGGESWKQGDWLISNTAGPVRRGPFGSALLALSDALGLSPLLLVVVLQLALLATLYLAFARLLDRMRDPRLSAVLLLSSASFIVFWVCDPWGSVRKELIAFVGLTLYALGASGGQRLTLWLGAVLYSVSVWAHEAMVLFLPTFLLIPLVTPLYRTQRAQALASTLLVGVLALAAVVFALRHPHAADLPALCAALTQRGLDPHLCTGAIQALGWDRTYAAELVRTFLQNGQPGAFAAAYVAALVPLLYLLWRGPRRVQGMLCLLLLAIPFLPLYPVAVDWGRWMSFHVFSATLLLACLIAHGTLRVRSPSPPALYALLALALLLSPSHTISPIWGGAARCLGTELWRLWH